MNCARGWWVFHRCRVTHALPARSSFLTTCCLCCLCVWCCVVLPMYRWHATLSRKVRGHRGRRI